MYGVRGLVTCEGDQWRVGAVEIFLCDNSEGINPCGSDATRDEWTTSHVTNVVLGCVALDESGSVANNNARRGHNHHYRHDYSLDLHASCPMTRV